MGAISPTFVQRIVDISKPENIDPVNVDLLRQAIKREFEGRGPSDESLNLITVETITLPNYLEKTPSEEIADRLCKQGKELQKGYVSCWFLVLIEKECVSSELLDGIYLSMYIHIPIFLPTFLRGNLSGYRCAQPSTAAVFARSV